MIRNPESPERPAREELLRKVKETIKKYSILSRGEGVLIGLSGGPDSVCLLSVLKELGDELKLELHALYIDHGLRPEEIPGEVEFCRNLCERLTIPFLTKSIDVKSYAKEKGLNKQAAARELRYLTLEKTAYEMNVHRIALGHTADDQAETLLMRLFRGSGPTGLSGIPPLRGWIIRPLIEIERRDIERYLEEEKIDFIVDSSNLRKDYLRNKIRLSLIPMLRDFNPNIIETLSKTAEIFRDEEKYFEILVAKTLMRLISRRFAHRIELFLYPLENMEKVILRKVLRRAIEDTKGLPGISFMHVEDIIWLIKYGKAGDSIHLPKGLKAIKEYSTLVLTSEAPVRLDTYSLEVPGEIHLTEIRMAIRASISASQEPGGFWEAIRECYGFRTDSSGLKSALALFDGDRIRYPLVIRSRKEGDFFYPLGFGKKRKLQDFFVDEKVPRKERDSIPLIISGEDIVWIIGYREDERFRVTEQTKKVLRVEAREI